MGDDVGLSLSPFRILQRIEMDLKIKREGFMRKNLWGIV